MATESSSSSTEQATLRRNALRCKKPNVFIIRERSGTANLIPYTNTNTPSWEWYARCSCKAL